MDIASDAPLSTAPKPVCAGSATGSLPREKLFVNRLCWKAKAVPFGVRRSFSKNKKRARRRSCSNSTAPCGLWRAGCGRHAVQFCCAGPPYRVWERKELGSYPADPTLAEWGGRYLFGGKRWPEGNTRLCWILDDLLYQFAQLPSSGDNWHRAFVPLSPTCALVSCHLFRQRDERRRRITAIHLAELQPNRPPHNPVLPRTRSMGNGRLSTPLGAVQCSRPFS